MRDVSVSRPVPSRAQKTITGQTGQGAVCFRYESVYEDETGRTDERTGGIGVQRVEHSWIFHKHKIL